MNRKTFLILIALLIVLGGAGLALFWQDLSAWRRADVKVGAKVLDQVPVNDAAQIRLIGGKGEATLALKDERWVVAQRGDYSASVPEIGELLVKLHDLKVVQTENVPASFLPRLELIDPGKDAKSGAGTRLELSDKSGKLLASLLLGKQVIKIEDSPLPIKPQTAVGRYILAPGSPAVLVVSDALKNAEARPERWLAKDFFKAERIRSLSAGADGAPWKIARDEEYGEWKFASGDGALDSSAAVAAVNALGSLAFSDVAPGVKAESFKQPRVITAETFDSLTYAITIASKPGGGDYYLSFTVSGAPPRERQPERGEKPEDKERLAKEFAENLKKLDERIKREKSLAGWTFLVAGKALEPLLRERAALIAAKRPDDRSSGGRR